MKHLIAMSLILLGLAAPAARAALNVLSCEPEWAALTQELAGDLAEVSSATTAQQDPHHIEARPSLLARARRADLLICTGAELETGWLPLLQREAGNARIQPGQPGYFEAARFARIIERPTALDRAQGDVHASGNPHLHLDPRNIARVADASGQATGGTGPGKRRPLCAAQHGLSGPLDGGHGALGTAGRAPEGHAGGGASPQLGLPRRLAGTDDHR